MKALRELDAIHRDLDALHDRLARLDERPRLEGDALSAVRQAEVAAINADMEKLRHRLKTYRVTAPGVFGWLNRRGWVSGVIAGVVLPLIAVAGWAAAFDHERVNYFDVSAQVIPVLVLAVAIEGRLFRWSFPGNTMIRTYYALSLLWMASGEAAALAIVASRHPTALGFGLTTGAFISAGVMFVLVAVFGDEF